jgi:curved DNA-binding protein CbpA
MVVGLVVGAAIPDIFWYAVRVGISHRLVLRQVVVLVKSFDPYDILGLDRSASAADVKRAFRQQAKKHHPDRGAARGKFEDVVKANLILSDAGKRAKYDADGTIDEDRVDLDPLREAKEFAVAFFLQLAEADDRAVFEQDILTAAKHTFEHHIVELEKQKHVFEKKIAKRRKMADRFRHADENDFVRRMLRHEANMLERNILEIERQVGIRRDAIKLVAEYRYEQDPPTAPIIRYHDLANATIWRTI